jgi:hypothetical protein
MDLSEGRLDFCDGLIGVRLQAQRLACFIGLLRPGLQSVLPPGEAVPTKTLTPRALSVIFLFREITAPKVLACQELPHISIKPTAKSFSSITSS